jgi:putative acetyltransferase
MSICFRHFQPADSDACLNLFRETVHRVNVRDYSPEQVAAWAPATIDAAAWKARFNDRFAYVALEGSRIIGFTDMTREGHLDRLFVSADHQRQGIARRLLELLVRDATEHHLGEITTNASITARPFFQSMGFQTVGVQTVECRGVKMKNFPMRRSFDP